MSISVEYNGETINYIEHQDTWECELARKHGDKRMSLREAKERIDAALKKASKFPRFTALVVESSYCQSNTFGRPVDVTSFAGRESTYNGKTEDYYWTVGSNGKRSKTASTFLATDTPENRQAVAEIIEMRRQVASLQSQEVETIKKMERIKLPVGESSDEE